MASLDREENNLLVVQLEAVDDGTDPGPQTGYASVSSTRYITLWTLYLCLIILCVCVCVCVCVCRSLYTCWTRMTTLLNW